MLKYHRNEESVVEVHKIEEVELFVAKNMDEVVQKLIEKIDDVIEKHREDESKMQAYALCR